MAKKFLVKQSQILQKALYPLDETDDSDSSDDETTIDQ